MGAEYGRLAVTDRARREIVELRSPPAGHWRLQTDGGCKGNPGPIAIGGALYAPNGRLVYTYQRQVGVGTNNEAEYHAMLYGLTLCARWTTVPLTVYADSSVVVEQINGTWKSRKESLIFWKDRATSIVQELRTYGTVEIVHVPRDLNAMADYLAGLAHFQSRDEEMYDPDLFFQGSDGPVVRRNACPESLLCPGGDRGPTYAGVGREERERRHLRATTAPGT